MRKDPRFEQDYRPNTRKMYEKHFNLKVLPGVDVHHRLPLRHGGKHEVDNLVLLFRDEHAQAHLDLYEKYGDPRDLCASYMISGRTEEAAFVASSMGGKASQIAKRERGDLNGFQLFSPERMREITSKAGSIGGAKQRELGIGIHAQTREERLAVASRGGIASIEKNGLRDSRRQSERGKKGGVKNIGARWFNDGVTNYCYTAAQQVKEPFDEFLKRTGMKAGNKKSELTGAKFYNDGARQWMFRPSDHAESFEEFLAKNKYQKGRLK